MKLSEKFFEIGAIRPPSEGGSHSLLLRTTRNCPWSRCKFCYAIMYDRKKFELRKVKDIKGDIDTVRSIADEIKRVSWELGYGGDINREVISAMVGREPELRYSECFILVFNWLYSGAKTAFLQDANSLMMPTEQLLEVLKYLRETFPSLSRITTYARSKTIAKKPLRGLEALHHAGLSRLHVGLETGDDELLKHVDKGVTSEEHILAGQKAKKAGFELSEYVMIDLGGRDRFRQHAENTARVLNKIDPDFVRLRPLMIGPDAPLFEDYEKGDLKLSSPHERLTEVKILVENLDITGRLCFDHFLNAWYRDSSRKHTLFSQDYNGYKFPEQKTEVLKLVEMGLELDESVHLHYKDIMGMKNL
jgi:radical SAM superfamily enzyme YgiQ (UPF0313 family)